MKAYIEFEEAVKAIVKAADDQTEADVVKGLRIALAVVSDLEAIYK